MGLPTNSIQSSRQTLDFNTTKNKKLIDMVSDFTLQLNFRKLPFAELGCSIKEDYPKLPEKAIKLILLFPTHICERPVFFHKLQTSQCISAD